MADDFSSTIDFIVQLIKDASKNFADDGTIAPENNSLKTVGEERPPKSFWFFQTVEK